MCFGRRKQQVTAPLTWEQVKALMDTYHVDEEEIDLCWKRFNELDTQGSGFLDRRDLFHALEQPAMYVTEFFLDAIGFTEDLRMKLETLYDPMFTIMTLPRAQIVQIMFDQMDIENAGWISNDEIEHRVCKFCGVSRFDEVRVNIRECIADADVDNNGRIQPSEFAALVGKLPRMFHPVFKLQAGLQQFTLGKNEWEHKMEQKVLRQRARQAELRKLQAQADALAAGEVPTTIVDRSLDAIPDPGAAPKRGDGDDDDIDNEGSVNGGEGGADDAEESTKTWRQRERDRIEAAALGGQWKPAGDADDDGNGGNGGGGGGAAAAAADNDGQTNATGATGANGDTSAAASSSASLQGVAVARNLAKTAKARVRSLFSQASQATAQLVQHTHFDMGISSTSANDDDMADLSVDGEHTTALMRRMQQSGDNSKAKKPMDRLIADARQIVSKQGKKEIRARKNRRQGMVDKRAPDRQERAARRKAQQRRQKLLNRVKQDIHEHDVKAGLIPDDNPNATREKSKSPPASRVRRHPRSPKRRGTEKVSPATGLVPSLSASGRRQSGDVLKVAGTVSSTSGLQRRRSSVKSPRIVAEAHSGTSATAGVTRSGRGRARGRAAASARGRARGATRVVRRHGSSGGGQTGRRRRVSGTTEVTDAEDPRVGPPSVATRVPSKPSLSVSLAPSPKIEMVKPAAHLVVVDGGALLEHVKPAEHTKHPQRVKVPEYGASPATPEPSSGGGGSSSHMTSDPALKKSREPQQQSQPQHRINYVSESSVAF